MRTSIAIAIFLVLSWGAKGAEEPPVIRVAPGDKVPALLRFDVREPQRPRTNDLIYATIYAEPHGLEQGTLSMTSKFDPRINIPLVWAPGHVAKCRVKIDRQMAAWAILRFVNKDGKIYEFAISDYLPSEKAKR